MTSTKPAIALLHRLGLYIDEQFLSPGDCRAIRRALDGQSTKDAVVWDTSPSDTYVDRDVRRAATSHLAGSLQLQLHDQLRRVMPALAQHFQVKLAGFEEPEVVRYRAGDFFQVHADESRSSDTTPTDQIRKVAVTICLNDPSGGEGPDFDGGEIVYYGLLPGPQLEDIGLKLPQSAGLLVGFSTTVLHEVTPIASGCRYAVVAWYH